MSSGQAKWGDEQDANRDLRERIAELEAKLATVGTHMCACGRRFYGADQIAEPDGAVLKAMRGASLKQIKALSDRNAAWNVGCCKVVERVAAAELARREALK